MEAGQESDELEQWLNQEIDSPAASVIEKAVSGARMSSPEWRMLIRFIAAQDVRTPASFARFLAEASTLMPEILKNSQENAIARLRAALNENSILSLEDIELSLYSGWIPFRTDLSQTGDHVSIQSHLLLGRSCFLYELRRKLTGLWEVLTNHRWRVLRAPSNISWLTSDDPVVRLNMTDSEYNFGDGWGSKGTIIFMPLSPETLLYTQIGVRRPMQDECLTVQQALFLNRVKAKHASRAIYSHLPVSDIGGLRGRVVDAPSFEQERDARCNFHEEQTTAEWEMLTRPVADQPE